MLQRWCLTPTIRLPPAVCGSLAGAGQVLLGSAVLTAGGDDTSTTYSGTISGSGGVVKTGAGIWTLAGTNTYLGGTEVDAGTLDFTGADALLAGQNIVVGDNGTIVFASGLPAESLAAPVGMTEERAPTTRAGETSTAAVPEPPALLLLLTCVLAGAARALCRRPI
jgi:fibronectin-binding autotransporter adhesin